MVETDGFLKMVRCRVPLDSFEIEDCLLVLDADASLRALRMEDSLLKVDDSFAALRVEDSLKALLRLLRSMLRVGRGSLRDATRELGATRVPVVTRELGPA